MVARLHKVFNDLRGPGDMLDNQRSITSWNGTWQMSDRRKAAKVMLGNSYSIPLLAGLPS